MFAISLKSHASNFLFDGTALTRHVIDKCKAYHQQTGTVLIYTKESGYHSGGWWKNPDYERCWHLSVSFADPSTGERGFFSRKMAERWVKLFFGDHCDKLWCEPPYTKEGKQLVVWHYRLFCDPAWNPIKPRGEVYSKHFTERGWKSFSELNAVKEKK